MKNFFEQRNPNWGALLYMKDLYSNEELVNYMVNKWVDKFNFGMTKKDFKQFNFECETLKLDKLEILSNIPDFDII